jgi:ribonuclease HI
LFDWPSSNKLKNQLLKNQSLQSQVLARLATRKAPARLAWWVGCYAFIIKKEENTINSEYGVAVHNSTNNVAEYTWIIKALEWLITNNYENENIIIRGD